MSKIIINFIFNNEQIKLQFNNRNEYMKNIFKSFCIKANKQIEDIYFLYNGNIINQELKLEQINNKDNEITILVNEFNETNINNDQNEAKEKSILCPTCGESCIIKINNYKITLNQCDNGHNSEILLLDEYFNKVKKIDDSQIICECNKKKSEVYNNQFFKC